MKLDERSNKVNNSSSQKILNEDKINVLLTDDEPEFLNLAKHYLTINNLNICLDICLTPHDALKELENKQYDVIVTDYLMPKMNGLEMLEELRKMNIDTPFILLTGRGKEEIIIQALNKGVDYYLSKETNLKRVFAELRHFIVRAVEKNRVRLEKIQAEKALQESEERFRTIYLESPIGILLYDSRGQYIDANKMCMDIYGVSSSSDLSKFKLFAEPFLIGEDCSKSLNERITKRWEYLFDFDKFKESNILNSRKSGGIILETLVTPLGWSGTEALRGYLVQVQDITIRKQAEINLAESEKKYRQQFHETFVRTWAEAELRRKNEREYHSLLKQATNGVFMVDQEGNILKINPRGLQILKYSEKDVFKLHLRNIIPEEELVSNPTLINQLLKGEIKQSEYKFQRKNGEIFYVQLQIRLLENGRLQGVFEDVSQFRNVLKLLEESHEAILKATEELKARFSVLK